MSSWYSDRLLFCMHEVMFGRITQRLAPVAVALKVERVTYRRQPLVILEISGPAREIADKMISVYGKYARRRARERAAAGYYLPEHLQQLWEIQDGRCYFSAAPLGSSFAEKQFSLDHLYPLATRMFYVALGTNWPTNLALVTKQVNHMKGSLPAADFIREVHRSGTFKLRPAAERRQIEREKRKQFGPFMRKHCSADEDAW